MFYCYDWWKGWRQDNNNDIFVKKVNVQWNLCTAKYRQSPGVTRCNAVAATMQRRCLKPCYSVIVSCNMCVAATWRQMQHVAATSPQIGMVLFLMQPSPRCIGVNQSGAGMWHQLFRAGFVDLWKMAASNQLGFIIVVFGRWHNCFARFTARTLRFLKRYLRKLSQDAT